MSQISILLASCLVWGVPAEADGLDALQGRWKLVHEYLAKHETTGVGVHCEWIIKGRNLTINRTATGEGTIEFDPDGHKGVYVERTDFLGRRIEVRGLYRLDGKTLRTCFLTQDLDQPPAEFPAMPVHGYDQRKWVRIGEAGGDGPEGHWKMVEHLVGTFRIDGDALGECTQTIAAGKFRSKCSQVIHQTIRVSGAGEVRSIDMTTVDGLFKGSTALGLYRLDGDRLTCVTGIANQRPTVIPEPGDSGWLRIFEKVKP